MRNWVLLYVNMMKVINIYQVSNVLVIIIKPETQDIHTRSNYLLAKLADRNIINNNHFY